MLQASNKTLNGFAFTCLRNAYSISAISYLALLMNGLNGQLTPLKDSYEFSVPNEDAIYLTQDVPTS